MFKGIVDYVNVFKQNKCKVVSRMSGSAAKSTSSALKELLSFYPDADITDIEIVKYDNDSNHTVRISAVV